MATFERVPDTATVFRLPKEGDQFPPGEDKPTELAFRPNSGDEREAMELGRPVAISVWDDSRTTEEQARAARASTAVLRRCDLPVAEIHKLEGLRTLRMEIECPGGHGHCGIEGLHTPKGMNPLEKARVKALRVSLVDIAVRAAKVKKMDCS
ncbi:MAG: hypothetical protein KA712_02535 [Myxococcales bacterium]|nr:hypothetical protein [Myxococcales bacterium]